MPASRAVEDHPAERGDDREDPDQDVDADDVGIHEADESAVFDDERAPLGEDLGEPAGGDQHRKGGHERDDIAVGDHDAVDQARSEADRQSDHDHHDPVRLIGQVLDRGQGRHDRGETHHGADRQVDAARDDDQRHTDADHADDRCLSKDHQRVAEGGEALTGRDGAHDHEQQQGQDESEVAPDRAGHDLLQAGLLGVPRRGWLVCGRGADQIPGSDLAHAAVPFMTRSSTPCSSI
jgi:hypothetical protein